MATFKRRDRAERDKGKVLNQSAMLQAEFAWFYSDRLNQESRMQEAYNAYFSRMTELGGRPYSRDGFEERFRKRMKKAGRPI
jgi:hypothetical protein